jgi:hypothetical protein
MAKPAPTILTTTILAGQAVSSSVNLTTGSLALLMSPDAWTPANISFLISEDNISFKNLFDGNGVEILRPMGAGRGFIVDQSLTAAALYLQIRSGPAANPVVQDADRTFVCVLI